MSSPEEPEDKTIPIQPYEYVQPDTGDAPETLPRWMRWQARGRGFLLSGVMTGVAFASPLVISVLAHQSDERVATYFTDQNSATPPVVQEALSASSIWEASFETGLGISGTIDIIGLGALAAGAVMRRLDSEE